MHGGETDDQGILISGTHMTAKITYVLYWMEENATGVTITTMKLKIQLALVERPFEGARTLRGTISAG
jgi:hypothetical protein